MSWWVELVVMGAEMGKRSDLERVLSLEANDRRYCLEARSAESSAKIEDAWDGHWTFY